jgi:putative glutamine amidotransferase
MGMKSVYVSSGAMSGLIKRLFAGEGWAVVDEVSDAELLALSGGEDVDPIIYNQHEHDTTYGNINRDKFEIGLVEYASRHKIPVVGICRGAQLLNILNGGDMWQDVSNHTGGDHMMKMKGTNIEVLVSSLHHQMMIPNYSSVNCIVLATAAVAKRKEKCTTRDSECKVIREDGISEDVEAVYYVSNNHLCYQPHPELYVHSGERYRPMVDNFFSLIDTYLFDEQQLEFNI